ncbi:MAG TPA: RNA polymerase sigma factor [Nannocystaceae bacterium]|nr:RNA polymerase sigma factor [Nannocystaceae bacterium]
MDDLDRHLPDIVAGDTTAFGRWVAGVEPRLRASLASVAGQLDAEAVLQECLLRVWQVAPRFVPDGRPDGLARLAIRIARNLSISELRRRRIAPSLASDMVPEASDPAAGPAVPDPLLRRVIALCREKLPSKPAAALAARLEGAWHPDAELARTLGMKLNTFLQNVGRARKLLAQCLATHGVDIEVELA